MANNCIYKFVGVSKQKGKWMVRYANSMKRVNVLKYHGNECIKFVEMPFEGREEDCIDFLLSQSWALEDAELASVVKQEAVRLGFVV